jgi:uncharacterized protein YdeI (YjbR/CyaY-like superfamily)
MIKVDSVEEFMSLHPEREVELKMLRQIALSAGLDETIKWNSPVYCYKGKNVAGIGAFKSYVGLWFYQGVFLKDANKKLINAQEGITKGLRQWRFNSIEEINADLIKVYLLESVENEKDGKRFQPTKKSLRVPQELEHALSNDGQLKQSYEQLSAYKKKEFAEYIGAAKKEATRQKRLEKCLPLIRDVIGLNDKYR